MKRIISFFILSALGFCLVKACLAEETQAAAESIKPAAEEIKALEDETKAARGEKCLKALEFLTGFGWGKLRTKNNYQQYPLMVDFDFDLKYFTKKINLNFPQLFEFQIEPFISPVSSPNANVEIGNSFVLKLGILPDTWAFQPYLKASVGMVYMTQHTREQGTQFNFIEFGGAGFHYFLNKNIALTLEGRFRHLSNASIGSPNSGINTCFALTGISYKF